MEEELQDLITAMFAVMTAQLEDAAALAVDGQRRRPAADVVERADLIIAAADDIATLARAASALAARAGAISPE